MNLSLSTPPRRVCILRLSALGDISHTLPVVRTLQHHWPETQITWIIGKNELELVKHIADVEFITFDKAGGFSAYLAIRQLLSDRKFDVLFHMQVALRASIISLFVNADIKLGFDRARAKDLQWLFCDHQITPASVRQHVVDSFLEFPHYFGLPPVLQWDLPVTADALSRIRSKPGDDRPLLVINACAVAKARSWRNWHARGYADVADYAATKLGLRVVLSGGPSQDERIMAENIVALCHEKPVNLTGKTTLAELVALLSLAKIVIAPDTGPAHIASALGTPVVGLYAATNPLRAAPYNFQHYVINKYPEALLHYYSQKVVDAPWGMRIRNDDAMSLITVNDVTEMLERVLLENKND